MKFLNDINRLVLLGCLALFTSITSLHAQTDSVFIGINHSQKQNQKETRQFNWQEKLALGGNFQAWPGNPSFIYLSPSLAYIPFENMQLGVGMIYNYTRYDYGIYGKVKRSVFGGHTFARYIINDSYFIQGQYDLLRQPDLLSSDPNAKKWVEYIMAGGGFRQPLGDKAALTTTILYNFSPQLLSIYPSRVIFQFGFTSTL